MKTFVRTISNLSSIPLQCVQTWIAFNVELEIGIYVKVASLLAQFTKELLPDLLSGLVFECLVFDDEMDAAENSVIDMA
jgi:hypothetical protein